MTASVLRHEHVQNHMLYSVYYHRGPVEKIRPSYSVDGHQNRLQVSPTIALLRENGVKFAQV